MAAVTAGIVVAAGSGQRLGSDLPKAFVVVAGRSLLQWSVDLLRQAGVHDVVAVVPKGWSDHARREVGGDVALVGGGATRMASVAAGLTMLADTCEVVAVHDAARPFMPAAAVRRAIATLGAASDVVAAAPGLPVADTLKRVAHGDVQATVDRADLVAIQTPQVFRRSVLEQAHREAATGGQVGTDDLELVERSLARGELSGRVVVTEGSVFGLKVTHPDDLVLAGAIAHREGL